MPVHPAGLDGARLDLPDDRFDAALSTMTLCTIPDSTSALAELHRVLKPGAVFHFAEHGRAPDAKVARDARPVRRSRNSSVAGGCHLNREVRPMLNDAGFAIERVATTSILKGSPKAWGYMYVGRACVARTLRPVYSLVLEG